MLNNEDFAEEYEAEIITLEDDLGNEKNFEFLDVVEYDGDEYIILLPEEDEEQNEVMILRIESIDDETENYVGIDDEMFSRRDTATTTILSDIVCCRYRLTDGRSINLSITGQDN